MAGVHGFRARPEGRPGMTILPLKRHSFSPLFSFLARRVLCDPKDAPHPNPLPRKPGEGVSRGFDGVPEIC